MTTELLFRKDAYQHRGEGSVIGFTAEGGIILDKSLFYATSGGQPGDSGQILWEGGRLRIGTAVKVDGGRIALVPAEPAPMPPPGTPVLQLLDWERRHRLMRVHTALHLLSVVIPRPVTGGQVGAEHGRLDFDMPDPPEDVPALTSALNALIGRDYAVTEQWISDADLAANGELIKTLNVKPPAGQGQIRLVRIGSPEHQIDLQPCGGTHVARTAEIGRVEITRIEKKGRINRRVTLALLS